MQKKKDDELVTKAESIDSVKSKKRHIVDDDLELVDELDEEVHKKQKGSAKSALPCTAGNIQPMMWTLIIAFLVIVGFLVFQQGEPEPEVEQIPTDAFAPANPGVMMPPAQRKAGQPAAWSYRGKTRVCPNCGWRGIRSAIDANGNNICPNCSYCPVNRRMLTGQGVVATTSASPKSVVIREIGVEVINTQRGVMVTTVYGNSFAEKGGLKHGDIFIKFNHKATNNVSNFLKVVSGAPPEKRVSVKVYRSGKKKNLNVMIGEGEMEGFVIPNQAAPPNIMVTPNSVAPQGNMAGFGGNFNNNAMVPGADGYLICSGCGFKMLQQGGSMSNNVRCPKCNNMMMRMGQNLAGGRGTANCPIR